jgi:hypothetical protein
MDLRIGKLASGRFYAFSRGYDQPEFVGTLEEVEVELGLREPAGAGLPPRAPEVSLTWDVHLRFQSPAWGEADGIWYRGIVAPSRSEANKIARKLARNDGHISYGKGNAFLTAHPAD